MFLETGISLLKEEKYIEAIDYFNKEIEATPNNARAFSERGTAFLHLKKFSNAILDMNSALKLDPNNGYRYASRAFVKSVIGDTKGAIADYEKAIEIDPEDEISYNNLGLVQEKLGYEKAAKRNFNKADSFSSSTHQDTVISNTLPLPKVSNQIPAINNNEIKEVNARNIITTTLTSKKGIKEFFDFILNGFKLK